ncbi:hypothetical protein C7410_12291 [Paraburkholderia silvatlantica]|uniref:Polyketide cyclase/dehydrase/lipid transport protein n=1 Tax=Paraburkholderia silvatlantica TaxID=321895 RepID=A0A2V4UHB5_9BURK|nr:SRPBCC domain-containing protein [Paraburkholderia silvatlantica]PYE18389.1 hypothetical protein C7410_12291 [Paraburkholderia silvatlantica]
MSEIIWPEDYLPGTTDFYVSNETIVAGLSAGDVWPFLSDTRHWPNVHTPLAQIRFHDDSGSSLRFAARFQFLYGDTLVQAEVNEYVAPDAGHSGRLAWHGWVEADGGKVLEAHCAWLIESLSGGRVRVVWQESLTGPVAKELAAQRPNPAVAAHQDWVDALPAAALAKRAGGH